VLGIDVAPTAIERARSLRDAEQRRTGAPLPGRCRLELGRFPDDLPRLAPEVGGFAFIMERGLLHHMRSRRDHEPFLRAISQWLAPSGLFYALLAKSEGAHRFGGPPTWSGKEVERAVSAHMEIVELRGSVFTPGEAGSIPAWIVVAKGA
jgi:SAM-dependent methyltransferase